MEEEANEFPNLVVTQKVIHVDVDNCLLSVWESMKLSVDEMKERKRALKKYLNQAYYDFLTQEYLLYDKTNRELINARRRFQNTKDILGAFREFIPSNFDELPLTEQIVSIDKLTENLWKIYQPNVEKCKAQYQKLVKLFNDLGIPIELRGEFKEDDGSDYSLARLKRINDKIKELENEKAKRKELNTILSSKIDENAKITEELVDSEVEKIASKKIVTQSAMNTLEDTNTSLMSIKNSRTDEVRILIRRIKDMYALLAVDERDWIEFSLSPTENNIALLEDELEFLESQKEERLPTVIELTEKEVNRLSDILNIPKIRRPTYQGDDKEEAVRFYRSAIIKLENQINGSTMEDGQNKTLEKSRYLGRTARNLSGYTFIDPKSGLLSGGNSRLISNNETNDNGSQMNVTEAKSPIQFSKSPMHPNQLNAGDESSVSNSNMYSSSHAPNRFSTLSSKRSQESNSSSAKGGEPFGRTQTNSEKMSSTKSIPFDRSGFKSSNRSSSSIMRSTNQSEDGDNLLSDGSLSSTSQISKRSPSKRKYSVVNPQNSRSGFMSSISSKAGDGKAMDEYSSATGGDKASFSRRRANTSNLSDISRSSIARDSKNNLKYSSSSLSRTRDRDRDLSESEDVQNQQPRTPVSRKQALSPTSKNRSPSVGDSMTKEEYRNCYLLSRDPFYVSIY